MEAAKQSDETAERAAESRRETNRDAKRDAIHTAAIDQFAARGVAGTSMARIAEAAKMSRPALYQYFRDKDDIFASAFVALFEKHVEAALGALQQDGTTAEQLDAMLQRFDGDLWQRMAASPHSDELVNAKNDEIALAIVKVMARLDSGLATYLQDFAGPDEQTAWLDVLRLSPQGFKSDQPTVAIYRRRLTALSRSVAADIDAS